MAQPSISKFFASKENKKKKEPNIESDTNLTKSNDETNKSSINIIIPNKLDKFAFNKNNNKSPTNQLNDTTKKKRLNKDLSYNKTTEKQTKKLKSVKLTPFEQQFVELKLNNEDKILAIQVGYKYKFFGNDAKIASKILNIMLIEGRLSLDLSTSSLEESLFDRFAYCSIPDNRLHIHLRRLIHAGLKVGVVDQQETAAIRSQTKVKSKVFERIVSRVYSPGTYIDDEDLEKNNGSNSGNSILCLKESTDGLISLVSVNVYIGQIIYDEFKDDFTRFNLEIRLSHLEPIEILIVGDISVETENCLKNFKKHLTENISNQLNILRFPNKPLNECIGSLNSFELNQDIFSFIVKQNFNLLICFEKLITYLKDFNLQSVFQIFENYNYFSNLDKTMILDSNTIKNLEIFNNSTNFNEKGSLMWTLDHTYTKFGKRRLQSWLFRPLVDRELIIQRLDAVESLINKFNTLPVERTVKILNNCQDLELALTKIHYSRLNRKEVYNFLKKLNEIFDVFKSFRKEVIENVFQSFYLTHLFSSIKDLIENDLKDFQKLFSMIYSPAAINDKSEDHSTRYFNEKFFDYELIKNHFNELENVESLLQDELKIIQTITKKPNSNYVTNNNEPYLIEIRNTQIKYLPDDWIKINGTKTVSRFRTTRVESLYKKLQYFKDILKNECDLSFSKFSVKIDQYYPILSKLIQNLSIIDALISLSISSINNSYNKPTIVDFPTIQLKNSRNPITEILQPSTYISNSFTLQKNEKDSRIALITGPNMGGKSSFMRQIALIVILSQIGCFIPSDSNSIIGVFNKIFIRIGSNDDLFAGKSSFLIELMECSKILENCSNSDDKSLILMDELGRGTATLDGCSIAWGVLDYFWNYVSNKVLVLFITHFKDLENFQDLSNGIIKNFHMGYEEINKDETSELLFTYKLMEGVCESSYGVNCAKMAGLNDAIVKAADKISKNVEREAQLKRLGWMISKFNDGIKSGNFKELLELVNHV